MTSSSNQQAEETRASRMKFWGAAVILLMMVLMVFSTNIASQFAHQPGAHEVVHGTASGGRKVTLADRQNAVGLLDVLNQIYVQYPPYTQRGPEPLTVACWGEQLVRAYSQTPEALALLLQEARANGPGASSFALGSLDPNQRSTEAPGLLNSGMVSTDDLRPVPGTVLSMLGSGGVQLVVPKRLQDGRLTQQMPADLPPVDQERLYAAFEQFLTIQSASAIVGNASKVSAPMVNRMIAENRTGYSIQFATFDAAAKFNATTQPSEEQITAQLAAFADKPAGAITPANPFGFGYRIPDRVKLEMIGFKRADVRKVVEAERDAYKWEVDARIAFAKDRAPFVRSLPTTHPARVAAENPATTQPSFDTFKSDAIETFINLKVDERVAEIEKTMRQYLTNDYQAYTTARASKATTTPSKLGVAYDANDYLEKLGAALQSQFKLTPVVYHYKDRWNDAQALSAIGSFSNANWSVPTAVAQKLGIRATQVPAPLYATQFAHELMPASMVQNAGDAVLEHYEPSDLVRVPSGEGEMFIFRLTDAQPDHAATTSDLAEVPGLRERVAMDVRLAEAQRLAREEATAAFQKLSPDAPTLDIPNVAVLAANVGPFGDEQASAPPAMGLDPRGFAQFAAGVNEKLLAEPSKTPVALIDVPVARKTFVVRRTKMWSSWPNGTELAELRRAARMRVATQLATAENPDVVDDDPFDASGTTLRSWLSPKQILARNDWKPERGE